MPINSARRTFLRCVGAGLTVAAVSTTVTAQESGWTEVPSPKDGALHDVVHTATGLYAVGDGGVVIKRTSEGWKTVFEDGPSSNGRNLLGAEVTDDGDRLWFVGKSGAVGVFDVQTDSLVADPSSPNDYTDNFNDVAVTGTAGQADVYVASNAGQIHYSFENGEDETWNETTVGEGNGIKAIDFHGDESGHAVTGNQTVFETSDGATYQKIGIADSDVDFFGIDSEAPDDVWVTGGSGTVYRWDGSTWTSEQIGAPDRPRLSDIEVESGSGITVGNSGAAFDLASGSWNQQETPTGQNLAAVARGSPDAAVGASGTILERSDSDGGSGGDGSGDGSGDDSSGDGSGDNSSGGGSGDDGSGDDSDPLPPEFERFDTDDSGEISRGDVINAIRAHNEDEQIGGESVEKSDVVSLISFYNSN